MLQTIFSQCLFAGQLSENASFTYQTLSFPHHWLLLLLKPPSVCIHLSFEYTVKNEQAQAMYCDLQNVTPASVGLGFLTAEYPWCSLCCCCQSQWILSDAWYKIWGCVFRFMPPDDPLGRHGPSLDNFLRKRPVIHRKQPCPYGKLSIHVQRKL